MRLKTQSASWSLTSSQHLLVRYHRMILPPLPSRQRGCLALSSFLAISRRYQVIAPLSHETGGDCSVAHHANSTRLIQRESHTAETACFTRWSGYDVQFIYNGQHGRGRDLGFQRLCQLPLCIQIKNISCSLNIYIYLVGEAAIQMCDDHGLTSDISS